MTTAASRNKEIPMGFGNSGKEPILIDSPEHPNLVDACAVFCGLYTMGPVAIVSAIATAIIGILEISGILAGMPVGAVLIASGSVFFLASIIFFPTGNRREKIAIAIAILASLAFITIGALGVTHVLSAFTVGWVSIGNTLTIIGASAIVYKRNFK